MEALKTAVHILNRVPSKSVSKTPYELWTGRKRSMNYFHVWGCQAEAKLFNPHLGKLDPKTVSCYFIGYPARSKGYRFYCPDRTTKFVETRHVVFMENDGVSGNLWPRKIDLEEKRVYVASPLITQVNFPVPQVVVAPVVQESVTPVAPPADPVAAPNVEVFQENVVPTNNDEPQQAPNEPAVEPVRRSQRERRSAIPQDYEVYMNEDANDIGKADDPSSYKEAMKDENSSKWFDAMKDEIKSMDINKVCDLVEIPNGAKTVGCKWVFKTKHDSKGNVERYKARLVAKGFTQREGIDYNETFHPSQLKILLE
ncbi:pol polyprotein [Panicum miliaceum]|uniref:Pol polyprotein n=1 Tax=Panicum miliaceum TaxID=4540 RepID=A0A3L6TRX6_PANMI|nr:pol polyprotein [Panicum miliaceum]